MNPRIVDQMAQQHIADLRQAAARAGPGAGRCESGGAATALRSRAGWALVHIGLRLAVRSADA